jgi:hypothetical protein
VNQWKGRQLILEKNGMNVRLNFWAVIAVIVVGASSLANLHALDGRKQTFTGEVGDAMCGRKHMDGTAAECTRTCVAHGSNFALIIGEKIYILQTTDKTALATLDQQAGKNTTVTGVLSGDTIEVSSVAAK